MLFTSPREKRLWSLAGLLVAATWSTLSVTRPVTEYLRDHNLLRIVLAAGVAGLLAGLLWMHGRRWPRRREWGVLGALALAYGLLFQVLTGPEEAMHFVQYGLLGGLVYNALGERRGNALAAGRTPALPVRQAAVSAVLLTLAAGWLDEGIQYLLPNRTYDLRDVAFNAVAGLLAVAAVAAWRWARPRPSRSGGGESMRL
jgi:VanZ family protein